MKKIMRYVIFYAALCVITVPAFILGGCERAAGGTPTLLWWTIGTAQPGFAADLRIISDYIEEKIGIRVDIKQAGWGDSDRRFNTMINAGEYFDILFVDGGNYARFTAMGAFADLTELLPETAPQLWDYIPDVLWEGVKVKGRIYSVPTYKDSSRTGYYFWDHRYVEKYGIDLNRSGWAYLDETFRRIKAGENNQRFHPLQLTRGSDTFIFDDYDGLSALLDPIGVRRDDPQRRVVNTLEQPDIMEAYRYFHSWYRDGIINPDANMVDEAPAGLPFFMAQAWPSVAFSYAVSNGVDQYDPVRFSGPFYSTGSIQGSMNAVSANSKYKREALLFLQLVNTDVKLRDMLHMGIEGKHFEYVWDGIAVRRLRTDWPLINYQQGTYFIETPLDSVPIGYWDEVRRQNETAAPSLMLGFMLDAEPVMHELVNCRSVYERYKIDLFTGAIDPDVHIPEIIAELKVNGFDRVMAEAQRQINEYFK